MRRHVGSQKSAKRFPEPYQDWITLKEFSDLARVCQKTARRRTRPGYPGFVVSTKVRLADGKQIILINPRSMAFDEQQRLKCTSPWQSAHRESGDAEKNAREPLAGSRSGTLQPQASLFLRTEVDEAIERARKRLPPSQFAVAIRRYRAIQPVLDHDFKAQGFERKGDFEKLKAREIGVSQRHFQRWRKEYKDVLRTAGHTDAFVALADERPGPERGTVAIDSSMKAFLWDCWVLKKWTRKQCCRALRRYLEAKQRGCGGAWAYDIPSDSTICRFINAPEPYGLGGDQNARRGATAGVKETAGYMDRMYDEMAGDAWCLDEFELDCYPYEDANHRIVYNYGRKNPWGETSPVLHILSVIDERTTCILDWILTVNIDDDTLSMMERLLRNRWVPLRLVADRASRFRQLSYGHKQLRSMGELADQLEGPLGALGVKPRGSEEKNPRANRIERMHHIYADMCRRDFSGHGWRPPKKVKGFSGQDLREATGVDELVQEHWRYHCGRAKNSPRAGEPSKLLPLSYVAQCVAGWVDEINNAKTDAKGCEGMTRLAAFQHFSPVAEEIQKRRVSQAMIDEVFAERRQVVVRPGGVIQMPGGLRYDARELLQVAGEEFQVTRLRRDHSQVFVEVDGSVVTARMRPQSGINTPEILERESAELARRRKLLGADLAFGAEASQNAEIERHISAATISSSEWQMARGRLQAPRMETAEESVKRMLELQGE